MSCFEVTVETVREPEPLSVSEDPPANRIELPAKVGMPVAEAKVTAVPKVPVPSVRAESAAELTAFVPTLVRPAGVTVADTAPAPPVVTKTPFVVRLGSDSAPVPEIVRASVPVELPVTMWKALFDQVPIVRSPLML